LRNPKLQSVMDNPETQATSDTRRNEEKQNILILVTYKQ